MSDKRIPKVAEEVRELESALSKLHGEVSAILNFEREIADHAGWTNVNCLRDARDNARDVLARYRAALAQGEKP